MTCGQGAPAGPPAEASASSFTPELCNPRGEGTIKITAKQYARLLLEMLAQNRGFRGKTEFGFRLMRGEPGKHRVSVKARSGPFKATISLRRGTSDISVFAQVFLENGYGMKHLKRWHEINDTYNRILRQGSPLILDLGANIGLASLYFAKNWPKAKIIAVEPERANYDLMCNNVSQLENVRPVYAAVAGEDGAVKIVNPENEAWSARTEIAAEGLAESVRALSVRSLVEMAPEGSIPFIAKIDIEGFERNLFSTNTDWVASFPIVILEPHDWMLPGQGVVTNFFRVLSQQDRDFLIWKENIICISNDWTAPEPRHERQDAVPA